MTLEIIIPAVADLINSKSQHKQFDETLPSTSFLYNNTFFCILIKILSPLRLPFRHFGNENIIA